MVNRWSIISEPFRKDNVTWVTCKCDCGTVRDVRLYALKSKRPSKSCGCWRRENTSEMFKTHGQSKTRLWRIWQGMKKRCTDPKSISYRYYGKKGVRVCKNWQKFENFYTWAISNGYKDNLTIERKSCNKGYYPSNCCWIPKGQQSSNRKVFGTSKYVGVFFETRCKRWRAYIGHGKRREYIGYFNTELAAFRARNKRLREND